MSRRSISLVLNIVLVISGAALGLAANLLANDDMLKNIPSTVKWLAVPVTGVMLLIVLIGRIWLYIVEHPSAAADWPTHRSPYPGLEAFTSQDADVFFGREAETEILLDRLSSAGRASAHRLVAVVGPSGVGKSSLLYAGLVARLAAKPDKWRILPPMTPGEEPLRNLARTLAADSRAEADQLAAALEADDETELKRVLNRLRQSGQASTLLIVDQAEELITMAPAIECANFLADLERLLALDSRLRIVLAVRSDLLTEFLNRGFGRIFANPVLLGALDRSALFQVVEKPAERASIKFEPGVVSEIIDDTGDGDVLPLLAYTLQAMHQKLGGEKVITADLYHRIGGVSGALAKQADKVAQELAVEDSALPVIPVLLRFVGLEGDEPVRRRVRRADLGEAAERVVDRLVSARLMHGTEADGEVAFEVVHEAIFRCWAPLREAIVSLAEDLRFRAQLDRAAEDWLRSDRNVAYLLREERLRVAMDWAAHRNEVLADRPLLREYLQQSASADDAAMRRLADLIARQALSTVEIDPERSALLSLAAIEECAPTPMAYRALVTVAPRLRALAVLRGHSDAVRGVSWSPEGDALATVSHDRSIRIWTRSGKPVRAFSGHQDWIRGVCWAPGGSRLATFASDSTIRIWDPRDGRELAVLRGHEDVVQAAAWDPTGERLASASHDQTVRVWSMADGACERTLRGHDNWVRCVRWSSDGSRLATASADGTVRVWDAADGRQLQILTGHDDWVLSVAWSPDDQSLASASSDGTVRIWRLDKPDSEPDVLHGHEDWVHEVVWSPDGHSLASCSRDRTVRLWTVASAQERLALRGHTDWVHDVAWSPDGAVVASASYDQTVRLWETADHTRSRTLGLHTGRVQGLAWAGSPQLLATASHDRTVRVWDVGGSEASIQLDGHREWVHDVTWAPDGRRLASASRDRTAIVWDTETRRRLGTLRGHQNWVEGIQWSPDGDRIATASNDRTVRVWSADTFAELSVIEGHSGWVRAVAWSPDSERLATVSNDRTVRLWRSDRGEQLHVMYGHDDWIEDIAWQPGGELIATASNDGTARIWNTQTSSMERILRGHEDWVRSVCWSPDGRLIGTGSADRTARIWDAASGTQLAVLCVCETSVEDVAWSRDGELIAVACRDGRVHILPAVPDLSALAADVRSRVFRELTAEERQDAMLPTI
jgi:WD40 repeat protein